MVNESEMNRIVRGNIRQLVNERGIKHRLVAAELGMTKNQFCDILQGRKWIMPEHLFGLRRILGCSYNDLFRKPGGN